MEYTSCISWAVKELKQAKTRKDLLSIWNVWILHVPRYLDDVFRSYIPDNLKKEWW